MQEISIVPPARVRVDIGILSGTPRAFGLTLIRTLYAIFRWPTPRFGKAPWADCWREARKATAIKTAGIPSG